MQIFQFVRAFSNSENLRVMRWGGLSILMRGNPCLRRCAAPRCDGRADAWTLEGRRTSVDFELTDKQRKLVATFRAFGEETFTPEHVRQWRRDQGLPDEVVKGFVDLYFGLEELEDAEGTFSCARRRSSSKSCPDAPVPRCRSKTTCSTSPSFGSSPMRGSSPTWCAITGDGSSAVRVGDLRAGGRFGRHEHAGLHAHCR